MSSHNTSKPTGQVPVRRVTEPPDPNEPLLERILERSNMQRAWQRVKANHGACGVDNMAVDRFADFARSKWPDIRQSLMAGDYHPNPVKRVVHRVGRSP